MKIDMNKKYRTRSGNEVRVLCVDRQSYDGFPVVYLRKSCDVEFTEVCSENGKYYYDETPSGLDLIEVSPYEDFEINDIVMVRNEDIYMWKRRHFAGVDEDGRALCFHNGASSWTSDSISTNAWNQCRRPTLEEIKANLYPQCTKGVDASVKDTLDYVISTVAKRPNPKGE